MKTGNGKIANLPAKIRDELNWRINDGEEGKELVEWLNAKPEVIDVVTRLFDGVPISPQNLSQWRTNGYRQWHVHHCILRELKSLDSDSDDFSEAGVDCEKLVLALTANFGQMIQDWIVTPADQMTYRMEVFKNLNREVLGLRHSEFRKKHLAIQERRLALTEKKAGMSKPSSGIGASSSPPTPSSEIPEPALSLSNGPAEASKSPEPVEVAEIAAPAQPTDPETQSQSPSNSNPTPAKPTVQVLAEADLLGPAEVAPKVAGKTCVESDVCTDLEEVAEASPCDAGSRPIDAENCPAALPGEPPHQTTASPSEPPASESPAPIEMPDISEPALSLSNGPVEVAETNEPALPTTPDQPDGKAPELMQECAIKDCNDHQAGRAPQTMSSALPAAATIPIAPPSFDESQSRRRRRHRRDHRRNHCRIPISSLPTPSATNPVTAPPIRENHSVTPTPPPPVTPPPYAPTNERPFWPNRRPGGPPRNASSRNPFGLL